MKTFDKAFEHTVGLEGGYSDHPSDKGGKTKYGITERYADENGYRGDIKNLTLEQAKLIYRTAYWDKLRLDDIAKISESIAIELFDTAVNMGTATAGKFLQRALLVLITRPEQMIIDGIMGSFTLNTLQNMKYVGWDDIVLKMLNAQQCVRYMEIVEKDPSQAVFLKGWISQRVGL